MQSNPFSLEKDWSVSWIILPSNFKRMKYFNGESPKELRAIKSLAAVGVISGKQLKELFGLDRKRIKLMTLEHKLVRHTLKSDKQTIPVYTLGANGAVMAGVADVYKMNYWMAYKIEDILKRLLFFQLYKHFQNCIPNASVQPSPKPFVGAIELDGKQFYVYVVCGNTNDFNMFLKWNETFSERIILLTESLRHLEPLKWVLSNHKCRIAMNADLFSEAGQFQSIFYFMEDGEFIREVE